jgi:hypothetical protein
MKQFQKIYLLLFLVYFATAEFIFAQLGDSCNSAFTILNAPDASIQMSFGSKDYLWLTVPASTPDVELEFSPDSLLEYTNIESIDLYNGDDCSSKILMWSRGFIDSLSANNTIVLSLQEQSSNYFIKVKRLDGFGDSFRMKIDLPEVAASCPAVCPNLISNPSFTTYSSSCVVKANRHQCPDPFNRHCVCAWYASHGTPQLSFSSATMGVQGSYGEGIYQDLSPNVIAGRSYFFSCKYISYFPTGLTSLNVELGNSNFNPDDCFDLIPPGNWDIPSTPILVTNNFWKKHMTCFTSNGNYSKIRLYPTNTGANKDFVVVDDINLIELDTPIPDHTINCNESATLTQPCSGVDSRIHYLWSTGETTASITVTPLFTTQYILTVSVVVDNQTICSYDVPAMVYVIPLPTPAMTLGSTTICNPSVSQPYCFTSNGALQYNFTVNPPNPTVINGNCINVQWNNTIASCGTIEVTSVAYACTSSQTFQFCIPCQGNPSNFTWCDETSSSILSDPQFAPYITGNVFKTPPGKWVTIHGTFTVDVSFTFNNSDVRFGPDAKIVVLANKAFEVKNTSHLHSCDGINMWDGIYSTDQSSLVYIHDGNNLIEDAKNAVVSTLGGNFEINATLFKNNYVGILVNAFSGHHPGKVYGTKFVGTGTLLSPYNAYCTMNYPVSGIILMDVQEINIGEPAYYNTYGRNIFQDLLCGILSSGSGMNVYTSQFSNMFDPPGNCSTSQGHGIYATGNLLFYMTINVGNQAVNEKCIFNSCKHGIQEKYNFSGKIQYNEFTDCDFPITNLYSNKHYNLIKGNVMNNFRRGIYFLDALNQLTNGLDIFENIFNPGITSVNLNTYGREAINVSNSISGSTNLWVIGNQINYSKVGIFARNVWEPCVIKSNIINFDISPAYMTIMGTHHGIQCENDNGLTIDDNIIQWRNQSFIPAGFINVMNGITINYSSNTVATSGGITENKIGPYPASNTGSTYGMGSGINISSECMGLNLVCNKMSRCEQGVTFNNADLGHQGYYDIHRNWYTNGNTFKYTPAQGGMYRIAGTVIQGVDWAYINADEDPAPFQPGVIYAHNAIYGAFQCLPPSPFLEDERDDNYGMLVSSDDPEIDPDYSGYEDQLKYAAMEKFYSAVKEDSTLLDAGVPEDAVYENLFDNLGNSNIAIIQDIKTSFDSLDFTSAAQKLNALVDSNLIEQNKKIAMQIYLQTTANETALDSSQIALLEPISLLHPLIGGEGVFWACAMLDKQVNNILPALRKAKPHSFTNEIENLSFNVYPNPAKKILHLKYNSEVPITLVISDITGKEVLNNLLGSMQGVEDINISTVEAGTYFLKVMNNREVVYSEKLIITR